MVRPSNLRRLALAALIAGYAMPAAAEVPLDWYIALKREAKYARIAAAGGASLEDLRSYDAAVTQLVARIENWDVSRASPDAFGVCLIAAQDLQSALQRGNSRARHTAIVEGEPRRDACLTAIQKR